MIRAMLMRSYFRCGAKKFVELRIGLVEIRVDVILQQKRPVLSKHVDSSTIVVDGDVQ